MQWNRHVSDMTLQRYRTDNCVTELIDALQRWQFVVTELTVGLFEELKQETKNTAKEKSGKLHLNAA